MEKFVQAQTRNLLSIERHLKANDLLNSSSDEEDEKFENDLQEAVEKVLSAYNGEGIYTEKTISYLTNIFQSGGAVCLICISTVKKEDPIWNCNKCYTFMHLSCILHWIRDSLGYKREKGITPLWGCPNCRAEFTEEQIPRLYTCFCGKEIDPLYHPWSLPHSCGEVCKKLLEPQCGHKCVLLCHPGPCSPCAKMVTAKCYCGKETVDSRRCNAKDWSCKTVCNKKYMYCTHSCKEICHRGDCPPCSETVSVQCHCKSNTELRKCNEAKWTCDKPCRKYLSCNIHMCDATCHLPGDCGTCPFERQTCPCGKKQYTVSCNSQHVPTCGDTCDKLLECGTHFCNMRCHSNKCGQCLEVVTKLCRCRSYKKEIPCGKEFHCNKKCTQMRLCERHLCNKKCCDCAIKNSPNICEKVCNNILNCRKHKCLAPCHNGPCYPCTQTDVIQCRCGNSKLTVRCGITKRIKTPACNRYCKIPPDCHHSKRETHKCHRGPCPPCKKTCGLTHSNCGHTCVINCHAKTSIERNGTRMKESSTDFLRKQKKKVQFKVMACPPCAVNVRITCLGNHETQQLACHLSKPYSCGRLCGKLLSCGNHTCELQCHKLILSDDDKVGILCMDCDKSCKFLRPRGCTHPCLSTCHPGKCEPCKHLVKTSCHCGIIIMYHRCAELTAATTEQRIELLKCGNKCPRKYPCGHRCMDMCHPGPCLNEERCTKKVKLWCKCKRIKREFVCSYLRRVSPTVECDLVCKQLADQKSEEYEAVVALRQQAENLQNQKEIERFERKFKMKHKGRGKSLHEHLPHVNLDNRYKNIWICAVFVISIMTSIVISYLHYSTSFQDVYIL